MAQVDNSPPQYSGIYKYIFIASQLVLLYCIKARLITLEFSLMQEDKQSPVSKFKVDTVKTASTSSQKTLSQFKNTFNNTDSHKHLFKKTDTFMVTLKKIIIFGYCTCIIFLEVETQLSSILLYIDSICNIEKYQVQNILFGFSL